MDACYTSLYSRNTNTSGNIIKHNLRTSMNERTHFFIKIYLSHFILERVDVSEMCERWVERHILGERTSSSHIFFRELGVPTLAPTCKLVRDASDRLRVPRSTPILCTLSKTSRVVLITWSPSGYIPVVPDCPDCAIIFLFTNQNVKLAKAHGVTRNEPKNPCHMLYNNMSALLYTSNYGA